MPFFSFLITFILLLALISHSLVLAFRYKQTKNIFHLKKIAIIWLTPAVFLGSIIFILWLKKPIPITKERIIGSYEIDTNFYPGANSQWQKENFRFEVTANSQFVLYEKQKDNSERKYLGEIAWDMAPPAKWSIKMTEPHQVVDAHPELYRSNKRFYYVFKSKRFGNMFFRKESNALYSES